MGRRWDALHDLIVVTAGMLLLTPFIIVNLVSNRPKNRVTRPPLITNSVINRLSLSLSNLILVNNYINNLTTRLTTGILRRLRGV